MTQPSDSKPTGEPGGESVVSAEAERLARECGEALDRQGWVGRDPHLAEIIRTLFPLISSALEAARRERDTTLDDLANWCEERWDAEVRHRPEKNVYRDMLDATWKQMMRKVASLRSRPTPKAPAEKPHVHTYQCADVDCEAVVGPGPKAPEGAPPKQVACGPLDALKFHPEEDTCVYCEWVAAPEGGETGEL